MGCMRAVPGLERVPRSMGECSHSPMCGAPLPLARVAFLAAGWIALAGLAEADDKD